MKNKLRISVRSFVEFMLRSGDLEYTFFGSARPLEGSRIHRKIQQSRPEHYTGEVYVSYVYETGKYLLEINGRIDGVYRTADRVIIDEIKTTTRDLDAVVESDNRLHWGQATCYAFMYAAEHGLEDINVQLTYCHLDSGETREIRRSFTRAGLEAFMLPLITGYLAWTDSIAAWTAVRDESIAALEFPYDFRPGQRRMAGDVYRTLRDGGRLIVQAPTGIGKTMAALFPAVKSIAEGTTRKIFYLTARTTGKAAAETALDIMREHGLKLKSLNITAKDKICPNPDCSCSPDECEYAKGHFDRLNSALRDAYGLDRLTREAVEELAAAHRVCPFEFSLELALWADCIVCDYNYAFDPRVYLRRFFEEESEDYSFLVDEAHNLVDRARDMFSAEIVKRPFLALRRRVKNALPGVYRALGSANTALVKQRKRCDEEGNLLCEEDAPSGLYPPLRRFLTAAERWLSLNIKADFREELLDLYFTVNGFLKIAERFDDGYAALYENSGGDLRVKLFCIDPARQMVEALERCRAAVFFSATMVPTDYFRYVLGCGESSGDLVLPSPFPRENLLVMSHGSISTLYRNREKTKTDVANAVGAVVGHRKGNYLCFFPSYEYMAMVFERFVDAFPGVDVLVQTRGMTEPEREVFLESFTHDNPRTLVGFAVMGGIFGEGIDLIGDRLTGAVIVGVGLPGISPEREVIRDYFSRKNGAGFEYAYVYPGINKVLQAAGRVIRSEMDRGIVLLIDERFRSQRYERLFPSDWEPAAVRSDSDIRGILESFWSGDNGRNQ